MFKCDEKVISVKQEDLTPVLNAAETLDENIVREALVDCTKNKFLRSHLAIYDVQFEDNICECSVWDEIRHDYILELTFEI